MDSLKLDGLREVDYTRDVKQTLPDGTQLSADVYRPRGREKCPVLLCRMPYNKQTAENYAYAHPIWYAQRGYMVVVQDVRGRWQSGGDFYPFEHEEADGVEAVEWAARLPGSDGQVGMYGFSYAGATQLLAAAARPPSLRAMVPAMTASQYHDGWTYQGGALSLAFTLSWAMDLAAAQALRRGDDSAYRERLIPGTCREPMTFLPLNDLPGLRRAGAEGQFFFDWLQHPNQDDYWQRWSLEPRYTGIEVPALHIGGWYDVFLRGTLRNFSGLAADAATETARAGQQLVVGPWAHMPWSRHVGCMDFGPDAPSQADRRQLAFFDRHLKNKLSGEFGERVSVFVMGENRWRHFDGWPPAGAQPQTLYLHSGGQANTNEGDGVLSPDAPEHEPPDVFVYSPLAPVGSAGGASCCFANVAPMGPAAQATVESEPGVLVYTGAAFEDDLTIIGPVQIHLWAVSTACDTDFTAKLCLVQTDGTSVNLCGGIVRARYRESLAAPSLIEPGRAYLYRIDLGGTAVTCRRGTRLRLQVSSSDFPQWDRNLNTGGVFGTEGPSAAVVATQLVLHEREYPSRIEFLVCEE